MSGILCEHCTAACCRYIALPLDKPKSSADFDDLRWFLVHEGVSVFVEDGDWYVAFETTCRHLQPDHHCGIYATRPAICRRYSTDDCDYHSGDYGWEQHFTCPEHLEEYLHQRGRRGKRPVGRPTSGRSGVTDRRSVPPHGPQRDLRGVRLPPLPTSALSAAGSRPPFSPQSRPRRR